MTRYQLLIQTSADQWTALDLPEDAPAMTYQANTLANLSDRQASYSQSIDLPTTSHNIRTLGFVSVFPARSSIPYSTFPCRLLCDGVEITPAGGAKLYIDSVSPRSISCQIVSLARDLMDTLGDLDLSADALGDEDYLTGWTGIAPVSAAGKWLYTLAVVDQGAQKRSPSIPFDIFQGGYDVPAVQGQYVFPAVPFRATVEKILAAQGFTLETDLDEYPSSKLDYIAACDLVGVQGEGVPDSAIYSGGQTVSRPPSVDSVWQMQWPYINSPLVQYAMDMNFPDPNGDGVLLWGVRYKATDDETRLSVQVSAGSQRPEFTQKLTYVAYRDFEGDPSSKTLVSSGVFQSDTLSFDVQPQADERLNVGILGYISGSSGSTGVIDMWGHLWLSGQSNNEDVQPGDQIDVLRSLGFSSQAEFLKAFLQTYGLTMDVDHVRGVVRAYTMKHWIGEVQNDQSVDWTGKRVVSDDEQVSYALSGYAQRNAIKFEDNDDDQITDEGVIRIADATLDAGKDLFTLPFKAGRNLSGQVGETTLTLANLSTYSVEEDSENPGQYTREYEGGDAHLLSLTGEPVDVVVISSGAYRTNLYPAVHKSAQAYVDEFYQTFSESVLDKTRVLTTDVLLDPLDVCTLDLFRPVWIGGSIRSWFYLSKVSNYTFGYPAQVELVALNLPTVEQPPEEPTPWDFSSEEQIFGMANALFDGFIY